MADLEKVSGEIRKYEMHLNQEKCTFGVDGGKFLGFMIAYWVIKANLDKCTTILEMHNPTNVQEIQKLNGRLASLSSFLLKHAEKVKPFYKLLRKTKQFPWDEPFEQAFLALKKTITTPPILSHPKPWVPLLIYLSVANEAVNSTLIQEEGKHQLSIYFISHILHDVDKWYRMIKKVVRVLITWAWRLRLYFQSHQVVVKMNYPIKQVLQKTELAGRIIAWSIEL